MKLTPTQIIILFDTLKDSMKFQDFAKGFTWSYETRKETIDKIMQQQYNDLINLIEGEQEDDDNRNTDIS